MGRDSSFRLTEKRLLQEGSRRVPQGTETISVVAKRVAVVNWSAQDGLGAAIEDELVQLGYETKRFLHSDPVPGGVEIVFSFAPYGPFLPLACRVAESSSHPPIMDRYPEANR